MSKQHAAAATLFAALAVVMTWPLARHLGNAVAAPGDPYINIWILDWDWWATLHHPLSLFQANAFHPARYALAFSENLYGIALLLFPLRALGVGPIAAYNVAMLAGFAFSGFTAYLLGRRITGSFWAGIAAGVFYAFVPFRYTHLVHLQHIWAGWLPLLIVALLHYDERPTWKRAALFGAVFLMNGLTNIHWLLFGSIAIAATVLVVRPRIVPLAASTLGAVALLAPFLWPYEAVSKLYGMTRSWAEVVRFSATPRDWLVASTETHVYNALIRTGVEPERWLFPGALAIAASLIAVIVARRERRPLAIALVWIALGFIGSLGAHTPVYRLLFDYVPGFRAIRVPARWGAIAYVGMAMLIALTTAWLSAWKSVAAGAPPAPQGGRSGRRHTEFGGYSQWLGALVSLAFAFELCGAPIRWYLAPAETPAAYRWLRDAEFRGAIVELPIGEPLSEYRYLLRATEHHKPLVNGISGFEPPELRSVVTLAHEMPIGDGFLDELRRIDCALVLVHDDGVSPATRDWLRRELDRGRLGFLRRFDGGVRGDWLFTTRGPTTTDRGEVDAFLAGRPTRSTTTFGYLDYPQWNESLTHNAFFSGAAFSPHGVRAVSLLFDNGRTRLPAELVADPHLEETLRLYPAMKRARFVAAFAKRPHGVRRRTDVQVEVIDGHGERTLLEDRWIEWP